MIGNDYPKVFQKNFRLLEKNKDPSPDPTYVYSTEGEQNPQNELKKKKILFALKFGQHEIHFKCKHVYLLTVTVFKYHEPPVR